MSKSLRLPEKWFRRGLWLVAAAFATVAPQAASSLDETQLDVRGYHGGQDEPAAEPTPEPEPEPEPAASAPESAADSASGETDTSARLQAIEQQLAAISEKVGIPYQRPGG